MQSINKKIAGLFADPEAALAVLRRERSAQRKYETADLTDANLDRLCASFESLAAKHGPLRVQLLENELSVLGDHGSRQRVSAPYRGFTPDDGDYGDSRDDGGHLISDARCSWNPDE